MTAPESTVRSLPAQPSSRILTDLEAISAYTLGRFLGLARMAGEPQIWGLQPEEIVETLNRIAKDYETVRQGEI